MWEILVFKNKLFSKISEFYMSKSVTRIHGICTGLPEKLLPEVKSFSEE
jgi:hypothetical protein